MKIVNRKRKLALLFPGQGNQKPGMALDLIRYYPEAACILREFSKILNRDMEELLCGDKIFNDTRSVHVTMTAYAVLAFEWMKKERNIDPTILAGHSLGEICALICSGAVSVEDGLKMADARGKFLSQACDQNPGGMVAFSSWPKEQMIDEINKWIGSVAERNNIWIVNINGPRQVVAAGDKDLLLLLAKTMENLGVTATILNTAGAFHTPFMNSAAKKMADYLVNVKFNKPDIPVLSSSTGRLISEPDEMRVHLALQIVRPVNWFDTMRFLVNSQISHTLEVTPSGGILSRLLKTLPDTGIITETTGDMVTISSEKLCSVA